MTDRETDYKELRPLGEATQIPDRAEASESCEQAAIVGVDMNRPGYPEPVREATDATCRACGAPIPVERTKCLFCLTNHIETPAGEQDTPDSECDILHIIHALVESRTFYGAVAKGSAACSLLAQGDDDLAVDRSQLIYDLDEEPVAQLVDQWPSLPSATRVTSESGVQLLAAARERTAWRDTTQSRHNGDHATFLYDETGSVIRDEERLVTLLEDVDDDVWLVPAIALQQSIEDTSTESPRRESPNRKHLECRECNRETAHRFCEFESVPNDEWTGQPMWECQVCGTPRYGPEPEADQ